MDEVKRTMETDEDDSDGEAKQVVVGVCAMAKKSESKPMTEILTRLEEFEYIKTIVIAEDVILHEPIEQVLELIIGFVYIFNCVCFFFLISTVASM